MASPPGAQALEEPHDLALHLSSVSISTQPAEDQRKYSLRELEVLQTIGERCRSLNMLPSPSKTSLATSVVHKERNGL
jgi:hypothetical protein